MRSRSLILLVAVTSIVMLGCGEDSPISDLRPGGTGTPSVTVAPDPGQPDPGDGEVAAPVATPAPEPEAEQPEAEQPEPEQPEPEAPPIDPADDDSSLVPILLGIGLLVLAAVVVGAVVSRRSSAPDERRAASPVPAPTPSPQMVLLTNAQWIHDHLTLELLAVPPSDALLRWTTERRRLDDVAIGAEQQFVNGSGDAWSSLNQTMTALANALDTNLRLRAQVPPDPAVIQESTAVVNRQRAVLIQLVAALWPTAAPPPTQR
jgi:hypothetical protein